MRLSLLSLRLRIFVSFLLMGILVIVVGFVGYTTDKKLSDYIQTFSQNRIPKIEGVWQIYQGKTLIQVSEVSLLENPLTAETRKNILQQVEGAWQQINDGFSQIDSLKPSSPEEKKIYSNLLNNWQIWEKQHHQFMQMERDFYQNGIRDSTTVENLVWLNRNENQREISPEKFKLILQRKKYLYYYHQKSEQQFEKVLADINLLLKEIRQNNIYLQNNANLLVNNTYKLKITSISLGVILSILLGILLSGKIARPVDKKMRIIVRELEAARDKLEEQVKHRTQELETALEELKNTQQQLIQTEKMSGLGQMVGGIAHEINNPASFIHGNLDHAHRYTQNILQILDLYRQYYPQTHPQVQEIIEEVDLDFVRDDLPKVFASMHQGTVRIKQIVTSLRNFSRVDEAEIKEADLNQGLDSALLILSQKLNSQIGVTKKYGEIPKIKCNPAQLNQVFMSMLSNAIDAVLSATHQQNKQIYISSSLTPKEEIKIQIRDNGIGIDPKIKSRIFDPFFTTKPIGQGTGLGLSVSYQIIQQHGGKIEVESDSGTGTNFLIILPIHTNQN